MLVDKKNNLGTKMDLKRLDIRNRRLISMKFGFNDQSFYYGSILKMSLEKKSHTTGFTKISLQTLFVNN